MSCSEFIDRFSDYFDGVGDSAFRQDAEAHLAGCCSCRRYLEVVQKGGELFRAAPAVNVRRDFYPRLRHRLYHLEDAQALSRGSVGSATTAATILGMAVLLSLVAWSPMMRSARPQVELSPIVVSKPPQARPFGVRPPPVSFSARSGSGFDRASWDLWARSHSLLWEYSRYGQYGALRQTALD
jgi:anti-sigma factor RsiW